jgi:methylenetetrahydrofolate dehydrogenase (NADP+)/methenyltetrahydrofolate cyclohydrolase
VIKLLRIIVWFRYVAKKEALAGSLGLRSVKTALPADCTQAMLLQTIDDMNADQDMDGILVQLPLPEHLCAKEALLAIDPKKDVDGFHPTNVGRLASWRESTLAPCTPRGVVHMLKQTGINLCGTHVAVVGESNVVGQPLALMLLAERATVTVVHKDTRDPAALCREADVVVSAAGVARLVTAEWVKPGATVIDVGINFAPDPDRGDGKARLCGDVSPCVWGVAAAVSPVPGGVGPMTVAMLMRNTVDAALLRLKWVELLGRQDDRTPRSIPSGFFADLDMDGDGYVSLAELRSALRSTMTDAQLMELMAAADADGDGKVSPAEVKRVVEAALARARRQES